MSIILTFFIVFYSSISCGGKGNNTHTLEADAKDAIFLAHNVPSEVQEIPEMGLLLQVEDAGYPFTTLTIEFPERNFTEYFTINMESVENATITKLNSYIGQYVKFTYSSEFTYALLDLFYNGKSIFGAEIAPEGESIKAIAGVLYGAEQTTGGDIPGEVSVFADDGENLYFPYFITQEMVNVNEKWVTAFYETRTSNTIMSIVVVR
jgi:hypothetical protein